MSSRAGRHTEITVLDVSSWLSLRLYDVVALFCQVLDEHLLDEVSVMI